jgi:hypothetical protein
LRRVARIVVVGHEFPRRSRAVVNARMRSTPIGGVRDSR